ncbi:MAG: DNA replication/repair protein RecF, partial [Cryomorphaceae bacterium]
HIGSYPTVVISPYDKDLISEGSEVRRRFTDGIISQYKRPYLDHLIQYNKVLKQRNSLLKYFWENRTFDAENLELWSGQLVELARKIFEERRAFVEVFEPVFKSHYAAISGNSEEVSIVYASHAGDGDFAKTLAESEERDRRTSYTNVGTHKDDLKFLINGYPLKKFGSQGQQKTFLIALKLAQFDIVRSATDKTPVLLLDDIFDKIDDVRVQHLMKLVSDHNFGQIFITDTHAERISDIFNGITESKKVFNVKEGAIDESRPQ